MKKITKTGKAVAGSALLLGATLVGAAGAASADLGDYPAPFVDDDGEVDTAIVVGDDAATIDVVGAVNIAGSLSQAAYTTEEQTLEVEGASAGWSATDGLTLNRPNSNLYLDDSADSGIDGLVEGDLNLLETQYFEDADGDDVESEHELNIGNVSQEFDADNRNQDEIELHLDIDDVEGDLDDDLFALEVFFDTEVDFTDDEMEGEEVRMFGQDYEVSEDTDESELVLFGDSESFEVEQGEEHTTEVDGTEHTIEVRYVSDDSATIRVDGSTQSVEEGDTVEAGDTDVRVRDIFPLGDGDGIVNFGIGSEEIVFEDGQEVEIDGDDVDATEVSVSSADEGDFNATEELSIYYGAHDRDSRFVSAGDNYEDPIFGVEFHYGGASPDAAYDYAEQFEVEADGDEAELVMTDDSGETAEITYYNEEEGNLGDDDGVIAPYEGAQMELDDYFVLNHDDSASMHQVTDVDWDGDGGEDTIVEFEDVFTGDALELDEDDFEPTDNDGLAVADFRMNRETYTVVVGDDAGEDGDTVHVFREDGLLEDGEVVVNPNVFTETDGAAFFSQDFDTSEPAHFGALVDIDEDVAEAPEIESVRVPSAKGSSDWTFEADEVEDDDEVTIGNVEFSVEEDGDAFTNVEVSLENDADEDLEEAEVAATIVQPQDDNDDEHGFSLGADDDAELVVPDMPFWGFDLVDFEDEDDLQAAYSYFGSYVEYDDDDEGEVTVNFPSFESTVGMAVTEEGGSLSADEAATDASYDETTLTGWPDVGALDSDEDIDERKTSENMILVGGPAVNTLTAELADEGYTTAQEDYEEGDQRLDYVEGAFDEDHDALVVAGYSGEDTRAASNYLANYMDYQDELAGEDSVNLQTMTEEAAE